VGHRGAWGALEVLSGSQKEDEEEGQRRSQVEALEEALSYLEARGDLGNRARGSLHDRSLLLTICYHYSQKLTTGNNV